MGRRRMEQLDSGTSIFEFFHALVESSRHLEWRLWFILEFVGFTLLSHFSSLCMSCCITDFVIHILLLLE